MALVTGTAAGGVQLVSGNPTGVSVNRQAYLINYAFGVYTGSTDSGAITGLGALVAAQTRSGKTYTLRDAVCAYPGVDSNFQLVYMGLPTLSGDGFTFNLTAADGTTELTTSTATLAGTPVG